MVIKTFDAELDERSQAINKEQRLYSVHTNRVPSSSVIVATNDDLDREREYN